MFHFRLSTVPLSLFGVVLAVSASHAVAASRPHLKPHHLMKGQSLKANPNGSRLGSARQEAMVESQGLMPEAAITESSSGWTPKHWLYVGCNTKPASVTFSTIQAAVAAAQRYTVIKVCPGEYQAGGADTGITVNTRTSPSTVLHRTRALRPWSAARIPIPKI